MRSDQAKIVHGEIRVRIMTVQTYNTALLRCLGRLLTGSMYTVWAEDLICIKIKLINEQYPLGQNLLISGWRVRLRWSAVNLYMLG